jgi:phosphoribosylaminoimidazole-succinocarboxamide synthase
MANSNHEPILTFDLPGIKKIRSGKVREIFDLGDRLLLVASDRLSAFDVIMPNGIPRKGEVLTQISHFWFEKFSALVPNHLLVRANEPLGVPALAGLPPAQLADLQRRAMIVKKAKPLAIECIVRGYLSGSGWKEYKQSQTVCGIRLPAGLTESAELPEPIFTPSTKAEAGHDENISFEQAKKLIGANLATQARDLSLKIFLSSAPRKSSARTSPSKCGPLASSSTASPAITPASVASSSPTPSSSSACMAATPRRRMRRN